jgi:heterodisulfide reductase subunit C
MKATAHWLELKGHTEKKPSTIFDEGFSGQVIATGKIEDGLVIRQFFARTGQKLMQNWLVSMLLNLARRMPVGLGFRMGMATVFRPRTRRWARSRAAIEEYLNEKEAEHRRALGLAEDVR